jgi:hypothetical protein
MGKLVYSIFVWQPVAVILIRRIQFNAPPSVHKHKAFRQVADLKLLAVTVDPKRH